MSIHPGDRVSYICPPPCPCNCPRRYGYVLNKNIYNEYDITGAPGPVPAKYVTKEGNYDGEEEV